MTRTLSPAAHRSSELFDHTPSAAPEPERRYAGTPAADPVKGRRGGEFQPPAGLRAAGRAGGSDRYSSPDADYSSPDARHSGIDGPLSSPISSKKSISFFAECRIISRRCPLSFTAATASAGFRPTLA